MADVYSAAEAYKASKAVRATIVEKELTVAMEAVRKAVEVGEFHCTTKRLSIPAKDILTSKGYEVAYIRDGANADSCTINWLNAG